MTKIIISFVITILTSTFALATQGAANVGCAKDFQIERSRFLKLMSEKRYSEAYEDYDAYTENCGDLHDQRFYWIKSDLSLAAYKKGDPSSCLDAIKEADELLKNNGPDKYDDIKTKKEMTPPKEALAALKHNEKLCLELRERQKKPRE